MPVTVTKLTATQIVVKRGIGNVDLEHRFKRSNGCACGQNKWGFSPPHLALWTKEVDVEHKRRVQVNKLLNYPWGRIDDKTLEAVIALLPKKEKEDDSSVD